MHSPKKLTVVSVIIVLIAGYILSYLLSSEIYKGQFQGTRLNIRLFIHSAELKAYRPLLFMENFFRSEFSAQIRSGASLPSPASEQLN